MPKRKFPAPIWRKTLCPRPGTACCSVAIHTRVAAQQPRLVARDSADAGTRHSTPCSQCSQFCASGELLTPKVSSGSSWLRCCDGRQTRAHSFQMAPSSAKRDLVRGQWRHHKDHTDERSVGVAKSLEFPEAHVLVDAAVALVQAHVQASSACDCDIGDPGDAVHSGPMAACK